MSGFHSKLDADGLRTGQPSQESADACVLPHARLQKGFTAQDEFLGCDKPVNSMQPLVSVVVTTYQHAPFLRQCLDSVLMQEASFAYELIIGEDDSTDGTRDICIEYAKRHPDKIRLFLRSRAGSLYQVNGMNLSLNGIWSRHAARGKYVALCDGDDYWTSPRKLETQISFLEANPNYSGAAHQTQVINADGTTGRTYGKFDKPDVTVTDTLAAVSPWHTSAFVYRRECVDLPDWFLGIVSRDMALFTITASRGPIRIFPEVMSHYRKHPGGVTASAGVLTGFHHQRIELLQHLDAYLNHEHHRHIQQVVRAHREAIAPRRTRTIAALAQRVRNKLRKVSRAWVAARRGRG